MVHLGDGGNGALAAASCGTLLNACLAVRIGDGSRGRGFDPHLIGPGLVGSRQKRRRRVPALSRGPMLLPPARAARCSSGDEDDHQDDGGALIHEWRQADKFPE